MKGSKHLFRAEASGMKRWIFCALLILFVLPLTAQDSWPLSTDWVPLLDQDWSLYDDPQDVSQGYIDFVPNDEGSCGYYYATSTSLFFRLEMRENPINKKGELTQNCWGMMLDVDKDNNLDWFIMLGGISSVLETFPNVVTYPDNDADATANWSIDFPYEIEGYVTNTASPSTTYPDAYYLDIQVPYSALQSGGLRDMDFNSSFKVVFGSGTSESLNFADYTGPSTSLGAAFATSTVSTPSNPDSYGEIYDTRDTDPYSNAGIWYRGETVTASGTGWPTSTSSYYTSGQRNVRILDSLTSSIVWSGTTTTGTDGSFTGNSLWTIGSSVLPGTYIFQVEDPRSSGTYNPYDKFEIQAPVMSISKSVDQATVDPGDTVVYTITINNTGTASGNITTIVDDLPSGFSYVSGTTTGLTTSEPSGTSQLTWTGTWSVSASDSLTLTFKAKASLTPGTYDNTASTNGTNFDSKTTGPTAQVQINGPGLTLTKSVDKASAAPGDTITYTINYSNSGNGNATYVFILESIPTDTDYTTGSASGTNMTITYSHNNGSSYDSSETPPVTDLSFQLSGTLAPGANGSVEFKVKVK